jgi:CheY-like chemotaxis protein
MNLCINAKDAMDGIGTLNIHLGSTYLENATCFCCGESMIGQFVQIKISDSGIGISDEMLPHIFDPYFTTKEIGRGTGVGLSMVDNLMHEHGGHLQVNSKPRQGTTFKLLFPPTKQITAEAATIHLGKSRYQAVHRGHILVVDDDRSVGTYVAEVLKHHGHKVTLEFDSVEALARYQDNPYVFDVVVTDQTMPEMTGSNLMLAMKKLREDIPVIICTAYSENLNEDTAREAGAKGYLGKPIDVDKLIELVDQSLAQNSSTAA